MNNKELYLNHNVWLDTNMLKSLHDLLENQNTTDEDEPGDYIYIDDNDVNYHYTIDNDYNIIVNRIVK